MSVSSDRQTETGSTSGDGVESATVDDLIEAIHAAYDDGETDALDGGVPVCVIANRLDVAPTTTRDHLRRLVADGTVEKVTGIGFDTGRPRPSYVPPRSSPEDGGSRPRTG